MLNNLRLEAFVWKVFQSWEIFKLYPLAHIHEVAPPLTLSEVAPPYHRLPSKIPPTSDQNAGVWALETEGGGLCSARAEPAH